MANIVLTTIIHAPAQRCFDLSRSIDLHTLSAKGTKEKAIAGRVTGLIEQGESVTWEATHFGIRQRLSVKIVEVNAPYFFKDEMLEGAFKSMFHEHHFVEENGATTMTDKFCYETPFGIFGTLFDAVVLKNYMTAFLKERNDLIKATAESDQWKQVLK